MKNEIRRLRVQPVSCLLLWALLCFLYLNSFGVFTPKMPQTSNVDDSWIYGLNQAVAQNLIFGKDIIFTFGPYASIFTRTYHPATAARMMLGTLALNAIYITCFLWLMKGVRWSRWMIVACILILPLIPMDAYLFSIPLLALLSIYKLLVYCDTDLIGQKRTKLCLALLFACLGLLPLIKGTLIIMTTGMCLFCAALFCAHRRWGIALSVLLCPVASTMLLWMATGQRLPDLPEYFANMRFIVSGYSEAMAIHGGLLDILFFLGAAAVILHAIASANNILSQHKYFLLIGYLFYIFLAFKAGYIRQDLHIVYTLGSLAVAGLFLSMLNRENAAHLGSRRFLILSLVTTAFILYSNIAGVVKNSTVRAQQHGNPPFQSQIQRLVKSYDSHRLLSQAIKLSPYQLYPWRFRSAALNQEFEDARRQIRQVSPLSFDLSGNVDLYMDEQSALFAAGYAWNPRPVFQSYSTYTPELIGFNERHLRTTGAPDNIVFRMETIDDRFPALDDGLSWPAMLDNYSVAGYANDWVHLVRNAAPLKVSSHFLSLGEISARLGQEVPVPAASGPIFVTLKASPDLAGKLLLMLYKIPHLNLTVTNGRGEKIVYRVNSNMMQTGFFLSPLVITNEEFIQLFNPGAQWREDQKVKSMELNATRGKTACWSDSYTITFQQYEY